MFKLIWKIFEYFASFDLPDTKEQKRIIDSFPAPECDYDRTYYNFNCVKRKGRFWVLNLIGIIGIPFMMLLYLINSIGCRPKEKADALMISSRNRIGFVYPYEDRFPEQLKEEFPNMKTLSFRAFPEFKSGVIGREALSYWWGFAARHPGSGFLNFRALITIMSVNRLVREYSPRAIINYRAENNNMTNLITGFLESGGREYINFMHGEILAEYRTAFVRLSRFYIWDEGYKNTLAWSRADDSDFYVYMPSIYNAEYNIRDDYEYYMLYIFSGGFSKEDRNDLEVMQLFADFQKKGLKCKVRPHPRWSDTERIRQLCEEYGVTYDDPKSVTTKESIDSARYIAGTISTVLTEAFYAGKEVVLDDVTNEEMYEEIKDKRFILLYKEHKMLSELTDMQFKRRVENV